MERIESMRQSEAAVMPWLAKVLAGHALVAAALELEEEGEQRDQQQAAQGWGHASGGALYGSGSCGSPDSSDGEGEQPFVGGSPARTVSAGLAERLAQLQLAMDLPATDAFHVILAHCAQASSPAPAQRACRGGLPWPDPGAAPPLGW